MFYFLCSYISTDVSTAWHLYHFGNHVDLVPPYKLLKGRDILNDIDPQTRKVISDRKGWQSKTKYVVEKIESIAAANGDVIATTLHGTTPDANQIVNANNVLERAMAKVYQFVYPKYSAERRAAFRVGEFKCLTLHGRMFLAGKRTHTMASSEPEQDIIND